MKRKRFSVEQIMAVLKLEGPKDRITELGSSDSRVLRNQQLTKKAAARGSRIRHIPENVYRAPSEQVLKKLIQRGSFSVFICDLFVSLGLGLLEICVERRVDSPSYCFFEKAVREGRAFGAGFVRPRQAALRLDFSTGYAMLDALRKCKAGALFR